MKPGLSSLLLHEELPTGVIPVYEIDYKDEVVYATKDGAVRIIPNNRYFGNLIEEENYPIPTNVFDRAVERILTEILSNTGIHIELSEILATISIESQDLKCSRFLTHDDLYAIPNGMGLAVVEPESL